MKTLNQFIEAAAEQVKDCPQGQYYCNKDKKCKKIPKGYKVNSHGWLRPLGGSYYTGAKKNGNGKNGSHNGNGNGNGNGGNGNGGNGNGGGGNGGGGE